MGYYQYQRKSEQERASSRCFEDAKVLLNGKRWGGEQCIWLVMHSSVP